MNQDEIVTHVMQFKSQGENGWIKAAMRQYSHIQSVCLQGKIAPGHTYHDRKAHESGETDNMGRLYPATAATFECFLNSTGRFFHYALVI